MNEVELGAKAFWVLAGAGILSGVASFYTFRRSSNWPKLRTSFNQVIAHLLEMRLFRDEPALVMRAQRDLIAANARVLRNVIGPSLLLALPFAILLIGLDAMFSRVPLQVGEPVVVTVQFRHSHGGAMPEAQLFAPQSVRVETPSVHVPGMSQISWRIRAVQAVKGRLEVRSNDQVITKSVSAVGGLQWLSDRRDGSLVEFPLHPLELPFSGSTVQYVSIDYPRATVFDVSWMIWFLLALVAGGLAAALARVLGPFRER